eukprot:g5737.t1
MASSSSSSSSSPSSSSLSLRLAAWASLLDLKGIFVRWSWVGLAVSAASDVLLGPVRLPSLKTYDPAARPWLRARLKAHRLKKFPPPFPNGWYRVCSAEDVAGGKVHSISALGREMVAFRGKRDGKIGVLHAYCPHLGAHLGEGGCVKGDTVECPFHGWSFNARGKCVHIPYSKMAPNVPERAKTKAYEVREILNMVFIWFDAEDRPPQWEPEHHRDVFDEKKFYYATMARVEFDQHVLEMSMNSADYFHFQTLHRPLPMPVLEKFIFGRHRLKARYFEDADPDPANHHVCFFEEIMEDLYVFNRLPLPRVFLRGITTRVTFEGPGIIHFSVQTPLGEMRMIKTQLPSEPFHQMVEARWYAEHSVPRFVVKAMAYLARNALDQDRQVWANKTYHEKPMLVGGDGPFPKYKRWWSQHYSENSDKMTSIDVLDW